MKPSLVDANVWLALLVPRHEHHSMALGWFDQAQPGQVGLCRVAQLAVIRLLGLRSIMGSEAISSAHAWSLIAHISEDDRVPLLEEPPNLDRILPTLFRYKVPTPNIVIDSYLAAFAMGSDRQLVTFDQGFRQFQGLDLLVLGD